MVLFADKVLWHSAVSLEQQAVATNQTHCSNQATRLIDKSSDTQLRIFTQSYVTMREWRECDNMAQPSTYRQQEPACMLPIFLHCQVNIPCVEIV